jgi:hypothetical protein
MAGWFITWFVVNLLWLHLDAFALAMGITTGMVLLSPLIFRWARIIWLNFFISYDKSFGSAENTVVMPSKPKTKQP